MDEYGMVELVIMMVNTGTQPIAIENRMLKKGEVAIYNFREFTMTGIVLQPAQ
jgi:hypothetical protein